MDDNKKMFPEFGWMPIIEDTSVYDGCVLPKICSELQLNWMLDMVPPVDLTPEEQVEEAYYRYTLAHDTDFSALFMKAFADDAVINLHGTVYNKREGVMTLRAFRASYGRRAIHTVHKIKTVVSGNTAETVFKNTYYGIEVATYNIKTILTPEGWKITSLKH
jgi:hypothetical protein